MLGTQNSEEVRLPDAHTHRTHKAIVKVKHMVEVEWTIRIQSLGAPGKIPKGERTES